MGTDQKVAVITGASQGIGAALVRAYRDRNYRVVATARSIRPSDDDQVGRKGRASCGCKGAGGRRKSLRDLTPLLGNRDRSRSAQRRMDGGRGLSGAFTRAVSGITEAWGT
jgi:NAD(P)-dependent dehydrogenase (short-subunit alcohol dehydrogenase family)